MIGNWVLSRQVNLFEKLSEAAKQSVGEVRIGEFFPTSVPSQRIFLHCPWR